MIRTSAIQASRHAWPHAQAAPDRPRPPLLAEIGFCGLLLLLLVTLHPFQPPAGGTAGLSAIAPVASDIWRQISFTSVFLTVMAAVMLHRPGLLARAMPMGIVLLLGWCLISAIWSDAGAIVFRRAVLITEVTATALAGTAMLGPERAFARLRQVLVLVLIVNWVATPFVPTAVHLPGETDPGLIGDWRGLYDQKNITGAVCALTVLLFFFPAARQRRWTDWLVIFAALGFLYFTNSKTSMALLPVAILFGVAYRAGWKNGLDRILLTLTAMLAISCVVVVGLLNADLIARLLEDPAALTGRTEIWQADIAYLKDHFFLGAGYASVFGTGLQSPLLQYLHGRNWVAQVSNSHNGYLDIALGLGAIGFVLAILALLVLPFARFWPLTRNPAHAGLFAIFVFIVFHNFTEADFLAADGVLWLAFLMVLGALQRKAPAAAAARATPLFSLQPHLR